MVFVVVGTRRQHNSSGSVNWDVQYGVTGLEDLEDYEEFKSTILKIYEVLPEAYRLQFRDDRKRPMDTYVAYTRYLEETFGKWLLIEDVNSFKTSRSCCLWNNLPTRLIRK